MPYFRHRSFVFAPASASLSTPMICSSVNRRLFIRLLPDEQTLLHSGTNLGEQTTSSSKSRPRKHPGSVREPRIRPSPFSLADGRSILRGLAWGCPSAAARERQANAASGKGEGALLA